MMLEITSETTDMEILMEALQLSGYEHVVRLMSSMMEERDQEIVEQHEYLERERAKEKLVRNNYRRKK